jgi:hypothetical protein
MTPEVVFTTTSSLSSIFVGGGYVYVEVASVNFAPYTGILGSPKTSGSRSFAISTPDSGLPSDAGLQWGAATATGTKLYYAVSSPQPEEDAGVDAGVAEGGVVGDGAVAFDSGGHGDGGVAGPPADGFIIEAALDGGSPSVLIDHLTYPLFVAVSGSTLLWVNDPQTMSTGDLNEPWSVLRCPLAGCTSAEAFMNGVISETYAFAVDSARAYLLAGSNSNTSASIFMCELDGGCTSPPPTVVVNANLPSSGYVLFPFPSQTGLPTDGDSFAGDGTDLYVADSVKGDIRRIVPATGAATTLVPANPGCGGLTAVGCPANLTLDSTYMYWETQGNGDIYRRRKDGTGPTQPLACGLASLSGLAVDDTAVYFTFLDPTDVNKYAVGRVLLP